MVTEREHNDTHQRVAEVVLEAALAPAAEVAGV